MRDFVVKSILDNASYFEIVLVALVGVVGVVVVGLLGQ